VDAQAQKVKTACIEQYRGEEIRFKKNEKAKEARLLASLPAVSSRKRPMESGGSGDGPIPRQGTHGGHHQQRGEHTQLGRTQGRGLLQTPPGRRPEPTGPLPFRPQTAHIREKVVRVRKNTSNNSLPGLGIISYQVLRLLLDTPLGQALIHSIAATIPHRGTLAVPVPKDWNELTMVLTPKDHSQVKGW